MSIDKIRVLAADGKWDEIVSQFRDATNEDLGGEGAYLKGLACLCNDDPAGAVAAGAYAVTELSTAREPADLVALTYALVGDLSNASYYRKLAVTSTSDPDLAKYWPTDSLPGFETAFLAVAERPLFQRGLSHFARGNYREAEYAFTQQSYFTPRDRDTQLGLAASLMGQNLWDNAILVLQGVRHVFPQDPLIAAELAKALSLAGRFVESRALYREALELAPASPRLYVSALLAELHDLSLSEDDLRQQFGEFGRRFSKPAKSVQLNVAPEGKPLNVLCVVGGSGQSRASLAITEILTHIDPRQFRLIGMGFRPLSDPANQVYQAPFDDWVDISDVDPSTFRMMVRAQTPHIIIDFTGLESPDLLSAFSVRMAPVQVIWQNHPFDFDLAGFTHIICDRWQNADGWRDGVAPLMLSSGAALLSQEQGAEAPVVARDKVEVGAIADFSDLHPEMVRVWAKILQACPDVTLLLQDKNFRHPGNQAHLIDLFGLYGLSHRVDVLSEVDVPGFLAEIDILLVPGRISRPSEILDAVSAGALPVMLSADNRLDRQSLVLLDQVELLEWCLGTDGADYAEKAIRLIGDAALRRRLQTSAVEKIQTAPLLNGKVRAEELSVALRSAYDQAVKEI